MRIPFALTSAGAASLLLLLLSAGPEQASAIQQILIYTGIGPDGYRHESIPTARTAVQRWGEQNNAFEATLSDDPEDFESHNLMDYDALVFISTAGTALRPKGVKKLRHYIKAGGGWMGVHEASDCLYSTPWYRILLGSTFNYHPERQEFTVDVHRHSHPSVRHLKKTWRITDEIYTFNTDPRKLGAKVVLTADESSYVDGVESKEQRAAEEGSPHPLAWYRQGNLLTGSHDDGLPSGSSGHPGRRRHAHSHAAGGILSPLHRRAHAQPEPSIMDLVRRAPDDDDDGNGSADDGSDPSGDEGGDGAPSSSTGNNTQPAPLKDSTGPGRSFYTGLGHGDNMWTDDDFLDHIGGGIHWLLNSPTIASNSNVTGLPGSEYRGPVADDPGEDGDDDDDGYGSDVGYGYNASAGVVFNGQRGTGPTAVSPPAPVLALLIGTVIAGATAASAVLL